MDVPTNLEAFVCLSDSKGLLKRCTETHGRLTPVTGLATNPRQHQGCPKSRPFEMDAWTERDPNMSERSFLLYTSGLIDSPYLKMVECVEMS